MQCEGVYGGFGEGGGKEMMALSRGQSATFTANIANVCNIIQSRLEILGQIQIITRPGFKKASLQAQVQLGCKTNRLDMR